MPFNFVVDDGNRIFTRMLLLRRLLKVLWANQLADNVSPRCTFSAALPPLRDSVTCYPCASLWNCWAKYAWAWVLCYQETEVTGCHELVSPWSWILTGRKPVDKICIGQAVHVPLTVLWSLEYEKFNDYREHFKYKIYYTIGVPIKITLHVMRLLSLAVQHLIQNLSGHHPLSLCNVLFRFIPTFIYFSYIGKSLPSFSRVFSAFDRTILGGLIINNSNLSCVNHNF